jgi:hypothetical protein
MRPVRCGSGAHRSGRLASIGAASRTWRAPCDTLYSFFGEADAPRYTSDSCSVASASP